MDDQHEEPAGFVLGVELFPEPFQPFGRRTHGHHVANLVNAYREDPAGSILWDYDQENPLADARGFQVDGEKYTPNQQENIARNKTLVNGARYYVDHAHPEYSCPEVTNARDLVVHETDEEQVELIIEELLARAEESGLEELEGLEANELLSELFLATDRLRRDVHDSAGVLGAVEHGRRLAGVATPFGFAATTWRSLRDASAELVDLLESEEASDDDVREHAHRLRDTLQRYV